MGQHSCPTALVRSSVSIAETLPKADTIDVYNDVSLHCTSLFIAVLSSDGKHFSGAKS